MTMGSMGCLLLLCALLSTGCSTAGSKPKQETDLAQDRKGPAVVYVRADPGSVVLDEEFKPARPFDILADIKDFDARIDKAKLRFVGVPLEIPMEKAGGSTWRARMTPRQLELLAVAGQTVQYQAHVVARDDKGRSGTSQVPVSFSIRAPELAGAAGVGRDTNTRASMESQSAGTIEPPEQP